MDCLLLHVPKFRARYGPFGEAVFINAMAVGLLSLADAVRKAGFSVQVMHLGLERILNPAFNLEEFLSRHRPRVVGISLNWHHQAWDSLAVAATVKRVLPDAFLIVGGHTASCFPLEILETCDCIDGVVQGEGEVPLASLMRALGSTARMSEVPNLFWRDGGAIVKNPAKWYANDSELSSFDFTAFSLLSNAVWYPKLFPFMFPPDRKLLNDLLLRKSSTTSFLVPLGRGCMKECAWCGGGVRATKELLGRTSISLIQPEAVMEMLERALSLGYTSVATSFNGAQSEPVLSRVFELCRLRSLKPTWNLDLWGLPSKDLLADFAATVAPNSVIELSCDFGSEEARQRYKGYQFTDSELLNAIGAVREAGLSCGLHFIYGLPASAKEQRAEKLLVRRLRSLPGVKRIQLSVCELEPMSPLFLEPEEFGIVPYIRSFSDFVNAHASPSFMGFSHLDRTEEEVLADRCRHMCTLGAHGRLKCAAARCITSRPYLDRAVHWAGAFLWNLGADNLVSRLLAPGAK